MIKIKNQWNTKLYNDKHSFVYHYGQDLIQLLNPQKNERILDLGCGSGQLTFEISQLCREIIGIDQSPEMIADARSNYKNIEFQVADASDMKFKEKFDAIFSNAVLHWVTNYEDLIKCVYDSLKSNGRIVFEFGGQGNIEIILNQLRKSLLKKGYKKQSQLFLWYFPSIGQYTTELEKRGFRVIFAQHFDRLTELHDQENGMKDWLSMFAQLFFEGVDSEDIEQIKQEVQQELKPKCFINKKWFADYKRIRVIATK